MAIQIPTIAPIATQQEVGSGRLTAQPQDSSNIQDYQTQAATHLASKVNEFEVQSEKNAADTISKDAGIKYQSKYEDIFEGPNGLKYKTGQAAYTTDYASAADELKKYKQSIIDDMPDASNLTKQKIQEKFAEMDSKIHGTLTSWAGKTQADHENTVAEATGHIYSRDLMNDLGHFKASDPSTLKDAEDTLKKMIGNRVDLAKKQGTLNPDGTLDAGSMYKIVKERSDAIYDAVANVAATRPTDAKALYEHFQHDLDAENKPALKEKIDKQSTLFEGQARANQLIGSAKSDEEINAEISKIKDPALQKATEDAYYTHRTRTNRLAKLQESDNYNSAAAIIRDRMKSDSPYSSVYEMQMDPRVAGFRDHLKDDKKRQALEAMINFPSMSNEKNKAKAFDAMFTGKFKSMQPEEFDQLMIGISKPDRSMFQTKYADFQSQTPSEETQMINRMGADLDNQMQAVGMVKKVGGFYSNEDEVAITKARSEMLDAIGRFPPGMSIESQNKWLQKFVNDKKAQQVFSPPEQPKFKGAPEVTKAPVAPTAVSVPGATVPSSDLSIEGAIKQFKIDNGRAADFTTVKGGDEFKAYYTKYLKDRTKK